MAPKKDVTYIKIDARYSQQVTRSARTDDPWDADDIAETCVIHGAHVVGAKEPYDFVHEGPIKDPMYLVVVVYSTGDSFHTETGRTAFAALVNTKTDADLIRTAIRDHANKNESHMFTVRLGQGRKVEIYPSQWTGYFESIDGIFIHPVHVRL